MLVTQNVVISVIFSCVFPKYSKSLKPEDCITGKTFWSTSIIDTGSCVKCPKHWRNCDNEAINDQPHCLRSCRVKPEKPSSTTTSSGIPLTPTPSLSVGYFSAAQPADEKEGQKPLGGKDIVSTKMWLVIVICSLGLLFLFLFAVLMVLIRKRRKRSVEQIASQAGGNEPGEQTPLTIVETPSTAVQDRNTTIAGQPIVQACSSTRISGMQDTEETSFSSALNIAEENH